MEAKDVRSIIDTIKDASVGDLLVLVLFLFPVLLGAWSYLLNSIPSLEKHADVKLLIDGGVAVVFILALIYTKCNEEARLQRAARRLHNYLRSRNGHRMSFIAAREEVSESYSDEFLRKVIEQNPELFRPVGIVNRGPGITLVRDPDEEPAAVAMP